MIIFSGLVIGFLLYLSASVENNERLELRVGAYDNAPKIYKDENGNWVGIFYELLNHIANQEGWDINWIEGTWTECLERLENGELDIMVDVAYTEARAEIYDFNNEEIFTNYGTVYTTSDTNIDSLSDLRGKDIAVMAGSVHTVGSEGIINLTKKLNIECNFIEVNSYTEVFEYIEQGRVDAGVVNKLFGLLNEDDYEVKKTTIFFNPVDLKFAFPKNASLNEFLITRIDYNLISLKETPNSIYFSIMNKYVYSYGEYIPDWVFLIIYVVTGVALVFLSIAIFLRYKVRKEQRGLEELDGIIQDAPLAIFLLDKTGGILRANRQAETLFEYSNDNLKELKIFELFPSPIFKHMIEEIVRNPSKRADGSILEVLAKPKTKDPFFVEVFSKVVSIREKKFFLTFNTDISKRKEYELKREEYLEKLQSTLDFKSKFLASVSHNLRTPLNAIMGFTELLLEKMYGELNETQIDRIQDIKTSASDLLELINSLLGISKMESGEFSLNCQIFNLGNLLDQIAAIIEPLYSEKNLKFEVNGLMPSMDMCADPLRFKEILYNLLSNAIKYTNTGEISLEVSQNKDYWKFKVIDTGIGIENKDLQLIFEEFIRVDSEELENIEGTGLGLTITKKLVELHGGQISVKSEPHRGSTFTFTISKNLKVSKN